VLLMTSYECGVASQHIARKGHAAVSTTPQQQAARLAVCGCVYECTLHTLTVKMHKQLSFGWVVNNHGLHRSVE
jgi:membrane-bound inhibitor of C-type lysozyme